jgi:hypothetical protein
VREHIDQDVKCAQPNISSGGFRSNSQTAPKEIANTTAL